MSFTLASGELGFVVRESALEERRISLERLLGIFEVEKPLGLGEGVLSFGPSFGEEAADEFRARLEQAGLRYVDDFCIIAIDLPRWCELGARAKE